MRVATYSATGLHAGRVVHLREVQGPQLWRIKLRTERDDGQIDIHEVEPPQRVPLRALASLVQQTIDECCAPGARLVGARMDFYIA